MTTIHTDVAIIGAGPVGLFSVFECGMMGLKTHVVDALDVVGGQCAALYPEKPIYDIPACPKISGGELIENLKEQAAPFDPEYHLDQRVERLSKKGDVWRLETSKDTVIEAKAVIIAAGVGAFGSKRPPLEGIEGYEKTSVFYYVKKRSDFAGKRLVIAGGGDSALDWVLSLSEIAESISVVHRRDKFRAAPESVARMKELATAGKIEMVTPYQLEGLEGDGTTLTGVVVQDFDGNNRTLPADMLLPFYGLSTNLGPIGTWGVEVEQGHIPVTPTDCQTNLSGIFAIGDIAAYEGKKKLILTGFAEAAQAAYAIRSMIHPDEVFHFEYSTTQGVPGEEKKAKGLERTAA